MDDREWLGRRWCGSTPVSARDVMDCWVMLIGARPLWSSMALDDVTGEFRRVIDELLQASEDVAPEVRAGRLRRVARSHGAFRRRQGCPALALAEEIAFANDAIEIALTAGGAPPSVVMMIQDSLSPVMRATERAMYSGYVDCGDWPRPTM